MTLQELMVGGRRGPEGGMVEGIEGWRNSAINIYAF